MSDPLHNSRYSIDHAKRRINELEVEIATFYRSNPYSTVVEQDPDGRYDIYKARLTKNLPVGIPGTAFDALTNLRSALDQAGYAVARAANTKGRDAKFPFGDNETEVRSRKRGQSKDIPEGIFDVMVGLQPYKGGNDLLWALNKACNSNKHEIVIPVGVVGGPGFPRMPVYFGNAEIFPYPRWDRTKNEIELSRFPRGATPEYKFPLRSNVAFGNIEIIDGKPLTPTLNAMASVVESGLMAIEGEARRLGLFP